MNDPVIHVLMGLDFDDLSQSQLERFDVVIAAMKAPELGAAIAKRLKQPGRRIKLLTSQLSRHDYLRKIGERRIAVLLPLRLDLDTGNGSKHLK